MESNITKYLESSAFFRSKCPEANMPAELCFDPRKVSQQGCHMEEEEALETAAESCMISAERSVSLKVHQTISGLMQPCGDYSENGQFGGELLEQQDKSDSSESSSLSDYDSQHSESFAISGAFDCLEEKSVCFGHGVESDTGEQSWIAEHDTEPVTFSEIMPDECQQVDTENPELVSANFDTPFEHEAEPGEPSELHCTPEGSEETTVLDLHELYCTNDQSAVFDLDSEPYGYLEQCRPNSQNVPSECHSACFESSELCQTFKESKPAGLFGSPEQPPPAGQTETTDDGELTAQNLPGSYTDSCENSDLSQLSDEQIQPFEFYDQQDLLNHNRLSENYTLKQCLSCGRYIQKCEIPEQRDLSELTDSFESPQQSEPVVKCLALCESFGTHCSVFDTSELPRENSPVENNKSKDGKRPACDDDMFFGSMETFETRWLSQFLDHNRQQNTVVDQEDLSIASTEPADELLISGGNDSETVIQTSDVSSDQRTLCWMCQRREKGQVDYDKPTQLLELCAIKAEALELGSDESRFLGESVIKSGSLDESSEEEEYVDCMDGKSQSSSETDESFKSFVDEPENFDLYSDQSDDDKSSQKLEEDGAYEHYTVQIQEPCELCDGRDDSYDLYIQDLVDAHGETPESCSEHKYVENENYKTYAEAVTSKASVENGHGPECYTGCTEAIQGEEEYRPYLNGEGYTSHDDEAWDNEPPCEEAESIEPHREFSELKHWSRASEVNGLLSEAEDTNERSRDASVLEHGDEVGEDDELPNEPEDTDGVLSENTTDPCFIQSTRSEISAHGTYTEKENIVESEEEQLEDLNEEQKQDLVTEMGLEEGENDEAHQPDFTSEALVKEDCEVWEGIDEVEGAHSPFCGEIEICEDDEASIYGFDDLACIEDHNILNEHNRQNGALDLLIMPNGFEVQPNKNEEPPESCVPSTGETEASEDVPTQSAHKLEDLICQVARIETTEDGDESTSFKLASQKKAASEEEDSEASDDDEDYPESCDCEFCVPSDEQVQGSYSVQ